MSIKIEMGDGYSDSSYKYRIFVDRITSIETNGDYFYTEYGFNNPDNATEKYTTFVAPADGTYYVKVKSDNNMKSSGNIPYNPAAEYKLTVTKVPKAIVNSSGQRYKIIREGSGDTPAVTNDFAITNGAYSAYDITNLNTFTGTLDNQLNVDWLRIKLTEGSMTKVLNLVPNDPNTKFDLVTYSGGKFTNYPNAGNTMKINFVKEVDYF